MTTSNAEYPTNPDTTSLAEAILALENLDEVRRFLRDLHTESEILEFSKRWQAAKLLNQQVPYTAIERQTGLSSTTVARVAKWLNGSLGGYQLMIQRLGHHHGHISSRVEVS